jgi:hypothetical protein
MRPTVPIPTTDTNIRVHTAVITRPIGGTPRLRPGMTNGAAVAARLEAEAAAAAELVESAAACFAKTPLTKDASVDERTASTG